MKEKRNPLDKRALRSARGSRSVRRRGTKSALRNLRKYGRKMAR